MTQAFFIQLAASGAAVAAMVGLSAWASIARPTPLLDEERARQELAEEFPGRDLEDVWVALDGRGAVAKSGTMALVLCRLGDGFVARQIPWAQALATTFKDGRIRIDLADAAAPRAVIALESWPPKGLKAGRAGTVRAA